MKFRRQKLDDVSVNLTPLIDVVFLLLIFFMVTTTFTQNTHLQIDLPKAKTGVDDKQKKNVELEITVDGQYYVNNRKLLNKERRTLLAALNKVSNGNNDMPFVIFADAKVPYEYVVTAMDVAGELGFVHIKMTTQKSSD